MFDKTYISPRSTEYVPYEKTVTINKPSTAEDLKLLNDIRESVKDEFIGRLDLQLNSINDGKAYLFRDHINMRIDIVIVFNMNGSEVKEKGGIDEFNLTRDNFFEKINDLITKLIKGIVTNNFKINDYNNLNHLFNKY